MVFAHKAAPPEPVQVAVVDDEADLCRCLELALEQAGLSVAHALDGAAGLELIRARKPRLIVLDIKMPRKNGYQVLLELQADPALAAIPVFVMTSLDEDGSRSEDEWARRLGVVRFFQKPFDPETLAQAAAELLERAPES